MIDVLVATDGGEVDTTIEAVMIFSDEQWAGWNTFYCGDEPSRVIGWCRSM